MKKESTKERSTNTNTSYSFSLYRGTEFSTFRALQAHCQRRGKSLRSGATRYKRYKALQAIRGGTWKY